MSNKKQLLAQFDLHSRWFHYALDGFTDEETSQRLRPHMNHVKYIAGHVLHSQYAFATIAGIEIERKWDELFAGRGKTKAEDNISYPTVEALKAEWDQIQPILKRGLAALPEAALQQEFPQSPIAGKGLFDATIGDLWAFLNMHQAYHLGQIGIIRRGFDKEPMHFF